MQTFFINIFNLSLCSTGIILAILLFRKIFNNLPKSIHRFLWLLVGIRLLCPYSLECSISLVHNTDILPNVNDISQSSIINSNVNTLNQTLTEYIPPVQQYLFIEIFARLWVVGCIILLIYTLCSYLLLQRSVQASLLLKEKIWICDTINTSFILGVIHPRIYIPSHTDEKHLKYIVAHEKSHLSQLDHIWKLTGYFILIIHWFNPLVWISYYQFCKDIELACDERVTKYMTYPEKKNYSSVLLFNSSKKQMFFTYPLSFGSNNIKERLVWIMKYKNVSLYKKCTAIIVVVLIFLLFCTQPKTRALEHFPISDNLPALSETETDFEPEQYKDFPSSNIGFSFNELVPGDSIVYPNWIEITDNNSLAYQITYHRTGLFVDILLLGEDGTEYSKTIIGGNGNGLFENLPTGKYQLIVLNSNQNLQYAETSELSLNVTGTIVFNANGSLK